MKRTLGRPTYAFEARQYVVSVCVMDVSASGVCVCVRVSVNVSRYVMSVCRCGWLGKALHSTCISLLINHFFRCSSQLMRQNVLIKEASVCAWLGISHMAQARVKSEWMIGEDDDFIPHHMYQLEVSCCSPWILGFPTEPPLGVNSRSVTSTWGSWGLCVWGCYSSHPAFNTLSRM